MLISGPKHILQFCSSFLKSIIARINLPFIIHSSKIRQFLYHLSYSFTGFSWHLYPCWMSATGPSTYPYLRWRLHAAFQIYVCPWSALHSLSQDYRTFFRSQEFLFRGSRIIKEWRFLTPLIAIPLSKTAITNSRGANFVDDVDNLITSLTRMTSLSLSRQVKKKNDLGYSARLTLIQICKFI